MPFTYEREPYRRELSVEVVETGTEGKRPYAVFSDTIFYPEGGGQPPDRGEAGGIPVLDVQKRGGAVRHYLERPAAPGPALLRLDWARRYDHMQQHTGQHLLTAVAADRFGWETLAFHLGAEVSTIEIGAPRPERRALEDLEEAVAAAIREARPVTVRCVAREEMASLGVRSRGLPEELEGDVRLVEIAGVDLNTCGGTHVANTAEIELVKVLSAEARGKSSLLAFVCGARARRRFGAVEAIAADLRSVLKAPDAELAAAARARVDALQAAERRLRHLSAEVAAARAAALAGEEGNLASEHLPDAELPFLQEIARAFVPLAPGKALLLTGGAGESGSWVLAAGEKVLPDLAASARAVAAALAGRGGGSGRVHQGRAEALSRRAEALAQLRSALG